MEITTTLSKAQADALFNQEAMLIGSHDVIPEYRITELFGESVGAWAEGRTSSDGCIRPGADYNLRGACTPERPALSYFYRSGFHKIVTEHNYLIALQRHRTSEAGKFVDDLWQSRRERADAEDAEEARKAQERREKRAEARNTARITEYQQQHAISCQKGR